MPKKMFYNISAEKRKMFLETAISEFTSKPFEQVSVNTIVKKAGISRGSFYTYFEDLESLFKYIFQEIKIDRLKYGKEIFVESKGDIFEFFRKLFLYDFDAYTSNGRYTLFRNYIHYVHTVKKGSIKDYILFEAFKDLKAQGINIDKIISGNAYNLSQDDIIDLFEVVVILMMNTMIKSENEKLDKSDVIELFNKRLSYIEYGVRKEGIR